MAYVNVAEWTPEQVCEWIRGLDHCLAVYAEDFLENKINGLKLLQLAPDLLANLGVKKIGHQVVLLQAIRQLQNIHYNLDQETLQNLALRLSSKARSIYNELKPLSPPTPVNCGGSGCEGDGNSTDEDERAITKMTKRRARLVSTEVIASVADCLSSVKMMVLWLNIAPFEGIETYDKLKSELVELGIKLATIGLRDLFAEDQTTVIRENCHTLSVITDNIIQNCSDPLIIQPASLDVVTIKKLPKEFIGLQCASTYDGVHPVCLISPLTPAHNSGKIHEGDHLVQVNYQTVIGWQPDKVGDMLVENNTEVILTIKKQPRHASGSTQIYFKPFRLPSKKRSYNHGYSTASDFTYRNDFMNLGLHSLLESNHLHVSKLSTVKRDITKSPANVALSATPESNSTADSSPRKEILLNSPGSKEDLPAVTFARASSVTGSPDSSVSSVFVTAPTSSMSPVTKQNVTHLAASDTIEHDLVSMEEDEEDAFLSSASDSDTCIDNEDAASTSASVRLYPPKPRSIVHRRATIPGDSVPPGIAPNTLNRYIEGLRMNGMALRSASHSRNSQYSVDRDYTYLRSPGDTCNRLRPHTTIGKPSRVPLGPSSLPPAMAPSFADLPPKSPNSSTSSNLMYPLPLTITSPPTPLTPKPPSTPHTPNSGLIGGRRVSEDRPKLDKSHSTPAYDFGGATGGAEGEVFTYTEHLTPRPDTGSTRQSDSQSGDTLLPPGKKSSPADSTVPPDISKLPGVCGGGRGVACRELGVGDHQGWLYRRSRTPSSFLHNHAWQKKWFILKRGYLYGYSHSTANKAESLIYLPGFHVCPAQDVKTKKFAFKIYHANGATFYFACDSGEERSRWMSEMGLSAISSSKCSDSGGSPSPPPLSKHDEEAYFSETDDETECSSDVHHSNLMAPVVTGKSDNSSTKESHGGLSSLFHWTMGGSGGGSTKPSSSGVGKIFQTKHVEAVPASNFRSYKRVRDNGRSTSTSDLCSPPSTTSETTPSSNVVSRKGSLREKLRNHLPAALSLDRKKRNTHKNVESKKQSLEKEEIVKEVINEEKKEEDDKDNKKEDKRLSTGSSDSQPITPLKCKLINNSSSGETPSGYKTEANHKSWMCNLKSSQGYPLHVNRVNSSQSSSSPNTPKTPKATDSSFNLNKSLSGTFSDPRANSVERLKRTGNYRPVTLKSREPMKAAFSMGLDDRKTFNKSKSSSFLDSSPSTPSSSLRPQVPPRTKFLSPSERVPPDLQTPLRNGSEEPKTPLKFSSSPLTSTSIASVRPTMGVAMIGKQRRTPGVLSPREVFFCSPPPSPSPITPHQHAYFPNTTLASTSTPYLSSNNSSTPLNPKSSASQLSLEGAMISNYNGKPIQVLPHYPNMEYPPIFEGGSYTISGSSMSSSMSALRGGSSLSTSINSISNSEIESSETLLSCLNATSPSSSHSSRGENESNKPWKTPRPPMPNPRSFTPNNSSMNQYCNLEEFSSPGGGGTSGGVVVGISCSPLPVVGHHHSIYVTSPAVPPPELPRRRSNEAFSRSADNILSSVGHKRSTPPSSSSLSRKSSGGSLLTPQRSDSLSSTYQHGGSSGGTVIAATVKAVGEPPKLVLPPPPSGPPP